MLGGVTLSQGRCRDVGSSDWQVGPPLLSETVTHEHVSSSWLAQPAAPGFFPRGPFGQARRLRQSCVLRKRPAGPSAA